MSTKESMNKARQKYNENVKQVAAQIDKNIYELFVNYCNDTKQTKKEVLEKAIQQYIDTH